MNLSKNIALLVALLLTSCQDFDTLVKNPNLPTSSSPSLTLTGVLVSMNDENAWSRKPGSQAASQFWISSTTYGGTNNYDQAPFTNSNFYYTQLQNVLQMEAEATKAGAAAVNSYTAMGKFLRAYYFHLMLQKYGDLPVTRALQGAAGTMPAYDSQKTAYGQVLKWLDESNTEFTQLVAKPGSTLAGDVFLGNSLPKWQKVVNTFTLRVLISLSRKESDPELTIRQRFSAIISDATKYPVMTGLSDNLQYVYNAQFNTYPKNPGTLGFDVSRENVASTFLGLTTSLNDPRTFIAATPAPAQLAAGKVFSDFAAYVGANPGDDMGTVGSNATAGRYSYVNALRYYSTYDGSKAEPAIIIGYPELCFNLAEGINRGWATGNANTWYTKGIQASMNHLGITEGGSIPVGDIFLKQYGTVTVSVNQYLEQPSVQYQGDNTAGLTQILIQKYIAFWQNSNWEAFFNQRRTGIPTFQTGPGTGNGGRIPLRWQYPFSERTANAANYTRSLQSQFGGSDDLNGKMWLLQ